MSRIAFALSSAGLFLACAAAILVSPAGQPSASPAALPSAAAPPSPAASPSSAGRRAVGCKPGAPIAVTLQELPGSGPVELELAFGIRPVLAMDSLRWELELPDAALLVEGETEGAAAIERGELTEGALRLRLPQDGRFRTLRLLVHGVFQGSDETGASFDEPVTAVAALSWGEPGVPTAVAVFTDPDTGLPAPMALMPSMHVPAPAPAKKGR